MKVINTSKAPFEFTFDSGNYGPIKPGEVMDLLEECARHAVKRSAVVDDLGEILGYRLEFLAEVDKGRLAGIATYPCPYAASEQCNAEAFATPEKLQAHMVSHWGPAAFVPDRATAQAPQTAKR